MKVILKTLNNRKYDLDVDDEQTIYSVKEAAQEQHQLGEPEQMKLIYTGKILKDDQTVASAKIKENGFIVVMVSKKKPAPVQSAAPSSPSSADVAAATPSAAPAYSPAAAPAPVPVQAPQPAGNDSALVRGPQYEETVERLMALGFERPLVVRALQASFNNPDRAAEYLFSGIPENVFPPEQGQDQHSDAASQGAAAAADGSHQENGQAVHSGMQQAPVNLQQFQQLLQARPELVDALINQIGQSNPQMLQIIGQNREAFAQMLQDPEMLHRLVSTGAFGVPGGPSMAGDASQSNVITITEEDRQAIERLEGLGFSRDRVLEAYLACERNEEMAANYLFDHGFEEEQGDSN